MGIKNLSGSGLGFRVSTGAGNFTKQLKHETRHGELQNLSDNKASILKVVKKYERPIRMGTFDRLRQRAAYREIKKLEGVNLNKQDIIDTKNLLKHLSEGPQGESETTKVSRTNRAENPNPLEHIKSMPHHDALAHRAGLGLMARDNGGPRVDLHGSGIHGVAGPSEQEIKAFEGEDRATRGEKAKAQLVYDSMKKLGGGEAARRMQKDSFEKMNNLAS